MRLWRALGVGWGGIGLFLDGYVAAPTLHGRKNPSLLRARVKTRQGYGHGERVSFIAIDAGSQCRCSAPSPTHAKLAPSGRNNKQGLGEHLTKQCAAMETIDLTRKDDAPAPAHRLFA